MRAVLRLQLGFVAGLHEAVLSSSLDISSVSHPTSRERVRDTPNSTDRRLRPVRGDRGLVRAGEQFHGATQPDVVADLPRDRPGVQVDQCTVLPPTLLMADSAVATQVGRVESIANVGRAKASSRSLGRRGDFAGNQCDLGPCGRESLEQALGGMVSRVIRIPPHVIAMRTAGVRAL